VDFPAPAVSVLVTVYNREVYLEATLRSILASSFTDFEVIVVDDCSRDQSVKRWRSRRLAAFAKSGGSCRISIYGYGLQPTGLWHCYLPGWFGGGDTRDRSFQA
jgi:cellulose synthase/poly-beta-1,6-N-acetylglucosamine synthase-like glycosyltransferase